MAYKQVAVTTDLNGQMHSACVWDILTGTMLETYKGCGVCKPHTLSLINDDFLVAAENDKPIIYFWSLKERQTDRHAKVVCPGRITALNVTPDGGYCIVAISEKIFVWQIATGNLINTLERHYQPICVIKTSTDGSHFITGGEDGLVLVWFLPDVLAAAGNDFQGESSAAGAGERGGNEPKYTWSSHSAKVTDVAVGYGGVSGRCATCSVDKTCRIYELASGCHLLTVVFDTALWSVAMDPAQYFLFLGGDNGNIYETKLHEKSSSQLSSRPNVEEIEPMFVGHKGKITCLSVSIDGLALLSGSDDQTTKLWHVLSKQCIRTVQHKGPIGNAMIISTPHGLSSEPTKPSKLTIKAFRRNNAAADAAEEAGVIRLKLGNLSNSLDSIGKKPPSSNKRRAAGEVDSSDLSRLRKDVDELKQANQELYSYAVNGIFAKVAAQQ